MRYVLAILLVGTLARADSVPETDEEQNIVAVSLLGLETLTPDLRWEMGARGGTGLLLTWPFAPVALRGFSFGPMVYGHYKNPEYRLTCVADRRFRAFVIPFVEPQWRVRDGALRLLAGAALPVIEGSTGLGALFEGAGVWGSDGRGFAVGAGVTLGPVSRSPWGTRFSLVFRWVHTAPDDRFDLAFDFATPIYPREWTQVLRGVAAEPNLPQECAPPPVHEPLPLPRGLPPKELPECDPLGCPPGACGPMDDGCGGTIDCGPCQ